MATGSAYLCEHLPSARKDTFWSDAFDGAGGNNLGICLMRLRGEYGGTGVVPSPWGTKTGPGAVPFASLIPSSSFSAAPVVPSHSHSVSHTHTVGSTAICMLPSCSKPVYSGHKFCGRTHGSEYVNSPLYGRCKQCNTEPKFYDRNAGRVHDYCGRKCAQLAGFLK